MSEPPVLVCPECGAPRAADGTPSCACAHRASEAHRESRTAEAAAAEDFDPVRIRPFVEVGEEPADPAGTSELPFPVRDLADVTSVAADAGLPSPEQPAMAFPADGAPDRRRRTVLLAGTGAAVAVLVTGGFLGGLFTYDSPSRDGSVAGGVRAGVPEGAPSSTGPSVTASSPTVTSAQSSAPPSSSPSAESSDSASPSSTATPTGAPSSAAATATVAPRPTVSSGQPPVLSLGDQGPEVVELQLRLRQVGVYDGEADGDFDQQVQSAVRTYQVTRFVLQDDSGVYGRATRASLESETSAP
ncbi:peptidoglycan-binding domain-containing protein [Streptomyces pseudovenezuelae]|uniref:peptidoglycan-binding domain-containing protein n=1 Tax=Streptomyces pseudovenezuelae TaxID=67350 RepID=UPI002E8174AA|nr:peptidoglycan-binding domain-containing protein [Streptomyces pseudovenezuelae]WUA86478.1 peptidoglycan-binding protein [Streptomyces pseudovenezuelae]